MAMKVKFYDKGGVLRVRIEVSKTTVVDRKAREDDKDGFGSAFAAYVAEKTQKPAKKPKPEKAPEPAAQDGVPGDEGEEIPEAEPIVDLTIFQESVTKALVAGGITTLDELTALTEDEVLERTQGIGPKKMADLHEALAAHGLQLSEQ